MRDLDRSAAPLRHFFSRRQFHLGAGVSLAALMSRSAPPRIGSRPSVDLIDPLIGATTDRAFGEGKTFPGAATPHGVVQLSPDTITGGDHTSGYSYQHTSIEAFSFTHLSGVGWYGDFGNLQVIPSTDPMKLAAGRLLDRSSRIIIG